MTWTATVKIPAGEQFDPETADIKAEEKYADDVVAAMEVVATLDGFDESKERTVNFSGYRSGTTNQVSIAVTQTP